MALYSNASPGLSGPSHPPGLPLPSTLWVWSFPVMGPTGLVRRASALKPDNTRSPLLPCLSLSLSRLLPEVPVLPRSGPVDQWANQPIQGKKTTEKSETKPRNTKPKRKGKGGGKFRIDSSIHPVDPALSEERPTESLYKAISAGLTPPAIHFTAAARSGKPQDVGKPPVLPEEARGEGEPRDPAKALVLPGKARGEGEPQDLPRSSI